MIDKKNINFQSLQSYMTSLVENAQKFNSEVLTQSFYRGNKISNKLSSILESRLINPGYEHALTLRKLLKEKISETPDTLAARITITTPKTETPDQLISIDLFSYNRTSSLRKDLYSATLIITPAKPKL